jgi:hypothetical protein
MLLGGFSSVMGTVGWRCVWLLLTPFSCVLEEVEEVEEEEEVGGFVGLVPLVGEVLLDVGVVVLFVVL